MASTLHEDLSQKTEVKISSARNFGIWFTLVFVVVALIPLRHGQPIRVWSLVVAAVVLLAAFLAPSMLQPLNIAWSKVGLLLGRVVNPIVMAAIFFLVVTPMAAYLRWKKKDLLRLRQDNTVKSYWILREGPVLGSMTRQF